MNSIKNIKNSEITLIITKPETQGDITKKLFYEMVKNRKKKGICLSLTRSRKQIKQELEIAGINTTEIYFIDVFGDQKNKTTIQSPAFLTDISIAISEALKNKQFDFLYFDSVSTLFIYNGNDLTQRFLHYIIGKMRMFGVTTIMVYSSENKKIKISQFYDRTIIY